MKVLVTSRKCWLAGWLGENKVILGSTMVMQFSQFCQESYLRVHIFKLASSKIIIIHTAERNDKNVIIVVSASPQHELERETIITFADEADALLPCFSKKKKAAAV